MAHQPACLPDVQSDLPFALLVEQMRQGAVVLDGTARIVYANPRFLEMIGLKREDLVARPLSGLVAPFECDDFLACLRQARTGVGRCGMSLRHSNGTVFPSEISVYGLATNGASADAAVPTYAVLFQDPPESNAELSAAIDSFLQIEERFRLATEALHGLVYEVDAQTQVVKHSAGLFELLGFRPDEVPQHTEWWRERIHPDDFREQLARFRQEVVQHPTNFASEYRIRHRNGEYLWVWDNSRLIYDSQGQLSRLVGCVLSIEGRKRAEQTAFETRRFLERVADVVPAILYIYDVDKQGVAYTNRHVNSVLGYSLEQFLALGNRLATELMHPDDQPAFAEFLAKILQAADGEFVSFGHRLRHADGSWRWFLSESAVLTRNSDGRPTQILGAAADITELKRAEEALRAADRRKDDFLAILGHELRNPLAGIVGAVEVLNAIGGKSTDCQEMRDLISRQARLMQRLIDDLLDVARIARGKISLERERIDLRQLVAEVCRDTHREFEQGRLTLQLDLGRQPIWCLADRERMRQVFVNLLQNACKFTDSGGSIRVGMSRDSAAGQARIEITDTGIGIDADVLSRLFEPFAQADRTLDRSRSGLGLGLALVRGIVELHGGQIQAHSEGRGKGSHFQVTLPMISVETTNDSPPRPATPAPALHPLRVLVIDDRRDAALPAQRLLQRAGHEVQVANDGPSGIAQAKTFLPDVVLCDIGLPQMDGYEVARVMRSDQRLAGTYLIAATGYGHEDDRQRATAAGFDLHVAKPIDFDWLLELIQTRSQRSLPR